MGEVLVQYERQLSPGIIGSIWLGRLASGSEAGRLVTIRRVPLSLLETEDVKRIRLGASACARLRSPSILKLLGVAELDGDLISVSEYLPGIRLIDLERGLIESEASIPIAVALRLILDVANAAIAARRLMMSMGVLAPKRVVVSDNALIALFGEVLLTDVGIMSGLLRNARVARLPAVAADLSPEERSDVHTIPGSPEVFTLGTALWQLLTNRWIDSKRNSDIVIPDASVARSIPPVDSIERMGLPVPEPVVRLVQQATHRDARKRFASLEAMADTLSQLPSHLIATTMQLQGFIQQMAPQVLPECDASATWSIQPRLGLSQPPPSRPVTLHPPGPHDWEPPTFAERRLVAPVMSATAPQSVKPEAEPESAFVSVRAPVQHYSSTKRSLAILLGAALVIAGATVALVRIAQQRKASHPQVAAETASSLTVQSPIGQRAGGETPRPEPSPSNGVEPPQPTGDIEPPSAPVVARPDPAPGAMPSSKTVPSAAPPPAPNSPYRPHKIAPYHPKGI